MKNLVLIAGLAVLAIAAAIGWQVVAAYADDIELHGQLTGASAQNGAATLLSGPRTEDEMRKKVIATAADHGLHLQPNQIQVKQHIDPETYRVWYDVTVDYTAPINLFVSTYNIHFIDSNK